MHTYNKTRTINQTRTKQLFTRTTITMGKKTKTKEKEIDETSEKKEDAPPTAEESGSKPEKKAKKKATKKQPDDEAKSPAVDEPIKPDKPKQEAKKKKKPKEENKDEEKAPDVAAAEAAPDDQPVADTEKPKNKKKKEKKPKENDTSLKKEQKTDTTVDATPEVAVVEQEQQEEKKKKKKKKPKDKSENKEEVKPEETMANEISQAQTPEEKPVNKTTKKKKDVMKEPENKEVDKIAKNKQNKKVNEDKTAVAPIVAEQPAKKDSKTRAKNTKVKAEATEPMIVNAVSVDSDTAVPVLNEAQYLKMLEMAALFSRIKKTTKTHNNMINDNNNTISGVEDSLANLEMINSPTQLIWRIPEFKRRFVDARKGLGKVLYSPELDSHRYGYKLGLSLCPNGDGKGAGTHMSLFFSILRGEYDELLPWPFSSSLRFTLMDQTQDRKTTKKNIVGTFIPNPTPQNMPFLDQPTTFRNPSLGLPRFAALVDIWAEEDRYVLDDIIFIKVEVDLSRLETRLDY